MEDYTERIKAHNKAYYEANREKVLERMRSNYDKERKAEIAKRHYEKHKDAILERNKKWREDNKEKLASIDKNWRSLPVNILKTREGRILKTYNISLEELSEMIDSQRGCCKICGKSLIDPDSNRNYDIDHNHETGKVRGLLCTKCNTALGLMFEDIKALEAMITYIKQNTEPVFDDVCIS